MNYIAYLPQTSIRLWGVDFSINHIIQAEYILKTNVDSNWADTIYYLNELIFAEIQLKVDGYIQQDTTRGIIASNYIFDCQFINKAHHFPAIKIMGKPRILDYSSLGHRFVGIKNLLPFGQFIRAIFRNYKFHRSKSPSEIIHWRYFWQTPKNWPIPGFWKNSFLDEEKIRKHSVNFITQNFTKFEDFPSPESSVLLICPEEGMTVEKLRTALEKKFREPEITKFLGTNPKCIIKQHRNDETKLPNSMNILGIEIKILNTPISRLVPSEIILLGYPQTFMLSAISSGIFCANQELLADLTPLKEVDRKTYGFLLAQLNKYRTTKGLAILYE